MSCSNLSRGLMVLAFAIVSVAASAGENVNLEDFEYQSWSRPKFGDALPIGGPLIRVYSEGGDSFDFVGHTNRPVRFWGLLTGACGKVYKISYLQFKVAGTTASVSHPGGRGAWFSRYGSVDVPHHALQGFDAVQACNDKLKTLAAESGRSRSSLVADGFGIHFPDWIEGRGILMCTGRNNSDSDTTKLDLWVECVGNPDSAEPKLPVMKVVPAKLSPLITGLTYEVDRPSYTGKCPVGLKFTGSITASREGTVRYRTVAHDGSTSPTYTLKFSSAGSKPVATWGETLSRPESSGALAASPGGDAPDYRGWRRLEIVEPPGFAPSAAAEYSVTCREQTLQLKGVTVAPTKAPDRIKQ